MQLISLIANKDSFRPVFFKNRTGINIIVASKTIEDEKGKEHTSNGVGKSLLVALIRFCLGSSVSKDFKEKLKGWEFSLTFALQSEEHIVVRAVDTFESVLFDGDVLSVKHFRDYLEKEVFCISSKINSLTFGSLFPFFIRPRKASYISENNPNKAYSSYDIQVINAFLLGLNVELANQKLSLKKQEDDIKKETKGLKNDPLIKSFFVGSKDVNIEKGDLKEKIDSLKERLAKLEVAQDYYHIKIQADNLKKKIDDLQNQKELANLKLENIIEGLKLSPDIQREGLIKVYEESQALFNDKTLKTLEQLDAFYKHISQNRVIRLESQKQEILNEILEIEKKYESDCLRLDQTLKYLDTHQALDMFLRLSQKLADLEAKLQRIKDYEELLSSLESRKADLKKDMATEDLKTINYMNSQAYRDLDTSNNNLFRTLVKRFYPKAGASITIENNTGVNQLRYTISTKIESDKSDGISNVKIFCYDLLLLIQQHNHLCNFIFHDSRLLDGIDPRQKYELFKIADEYFKSHNKQYIISANYNQLDDMKDLFESEAEYKEIIESNITHQLGDTSPEEKLLGVQLDLDYDS